MSTCIPHYSSSTWLTQTIFSKKCIWKVTWNDEKSWRITSKWGSVGFSPRKHNAIWYKWSFNLKTLPVRQFGNTNTTPHLPLSSSRGTGVGGDAGGQHWRLLPAHFNATSSSKKNSPPRYGNLITAGNRSLANKAASSNIKEKPNRIFVSGSEIDLWMGARRNTWGCAYLCIFLRENTNKLNCLGIQHLQVDSDHTEVNSKIPFIYWMPTVSHYGLSPASSCHITEGFKHPK